METCASGSGLGFGNTQNLLPGIRGCQGGWAGDSATDSDEKGISEGLPHTACIRCEPYCPQEGYIPTWVGGKEAGMREMQGEETRGGGLRQEG